MNRYLLILSIILTGLYIPGQAQSGLRPAGKYEVNDTTIEVYNVGEFNTIREFKTIHGTNIIQYREFNKLTKKLREEGVFKNGYSSGIWKFYGWTGRLKREINYDGKVKTYYVKKEGEIEVTEEAALAFDFEKFKQDSIFVANYRKKNNPAFAAKGNSQTTTIQPTVAKKDTLPTSAASATTMLATINAPAPVTIDSTKQKSNTGLLGKLNIFKKTDAKKEEVKPQATDSAKIKPVLVNKPIDPKKENVTALNSKAPLVKKEEEKKKAATELKKENAAITKSEPVNKQAEQKKESAAETKPAPAVASKPVEPKKETAAEKKPVPAEEKKSAPAVASKPVEPKKETAAEKKPLPAEEKKSPPAVASKPVEPKKETAAEKKPVPAAEKKSAPVVASKPVEPKKEIAAEKKPVPAEEKKSAPAVASKPVEPKKETAAEKKPALAEEKKPAPVVASKPVEPKKEKPEEKKILSAGMNTPVEPKKETPKETKTTPAVVNKSTEPKKENTAGTPAKKEEAKSNADQLKNKTTINSTNKTVQKTGDAKPVDKTTVAAKQAVTVENKQPKTPLDTANKKMEDALTKKWKALKVENDKLEQSLKAHRRDSLHADSIKKGLIKLPVEQNKKVTPTGTSK